MKRLIQFSILIVVIAFLINSCSKNEPKNKITLTILATNDVHSRIDPIPENDKKFAFMGGFSQRQTYIQKVRSEVDEVVLLDAGDVFQGTPYFNKFGGALEYKLMSKMGYDAAALGNHDLDNGIDGLSKQLPHCNFPLLCANYDFSNTSLKNAIKPFVIVEKSGIRIGIIGLGVNPAGLITEANIGAIEFLNPISIANQYADSLVKMGCDYIICLSHLGYAYEDSTLASDKNLAQQSKNINYIIGGHTHTFFEKMEEVENQLGTKVKISQCGKNGVQISRLDLVFTRIVN